MTTKETNPTSSSDKFLRVPPERVPYVEQEIRRYRNASVHSENDGQVKIPHIELHSINSLIDFATYLQEVIKQENPNTGSETDKEWCIGIHPYINEENRLSFYFIPTIVKTGTLNTQGTSVAKDSFTDYLDILDSSNTSIKELVKNSIYNIGNHYP